MRHNIKGKKFGRYSSHRNALLGNMACSLIKHEHISTTLVKAKALRPIVEKLVTAAKDSSLPTRRHLLSGLRNNIVTVNKLVNELGPRFKTRPGGYLRVVKRGFRTGDNAPMAIIQFVDYQPKTVELATQNS